MQPIRKPSDRHARIGAPETPRRRFQLDRHGGDGPVPAPGYFATTACRLVDRRGLVIAERDALGVRGLVRLLFNYARSIRGDDGNPVVTGNPVEVLSQRRIWHNEKPKREVLSAPTPPKLLVVFL